MLTIIQAAYFVQSSFFLADRVGKRRQRRGLHLGPSKRNETGGNENWEPLIEGDTIIVFELSRLGRSTLQISEIMKEAKERGVAVHAVKSGWELNGSLESKIVLMMLAMVAEIERDLISERTKEGLRARKKAGVQLCRPKGPGKSKKNEIKIEDGAG